VRRAQQSPRRGGPSDQASSRQGRRSPRATGTGYAVWSPRVQPPPRARPIHEIPPNRVISLDGRSGSASRPPTRPFSRVLSPASMGGWRCPRASPVTGSCRWSTCTVTSWAPSAAKAAIKAVQIRQHNRTRRHRNRQSSPRRSRSITSRPGRRTHRKQGMQLLHRRNPRRHRPRASPHRRHPSRGHRRTPFSVDGDGWVLSGDLQVGDHLAQHNHTTTTIKSITRSQRVVTMAIPTSR